MPPLLWVAYKVCRLSTVSENKECSLLVSETHGQPKWVRMPWRLSKDLKMPTKALDRGHDLPQRRYLGRPGCLLSCPTSRGPHHEGKLRDRCKKWVITKRNNIWLWWLNAKRRNSSVLALELRLLLHSAINLYCTLNISVKWMPLLMPIEQHFICLLKAQCKTVVTPVRLQWSYCIFAISHWYYVLIRT